MFLRIVATLSAAVDALWPGAGFRARLGLGCLRGLGVVLFRGVIPLGGCVVE